MAETERKLYIGCLPLDISENELQEEFGVYGEIEEVIVLHGKDQQRQDRCAFVKFYEKDEAAAAKAVLGDFYKFRQNCPEAIRISFARPGKDANNANRGPAPGTNAGGNASANAPPNMPPPPAPPPGPSAMPPAPSAPGAQGGSVKLWVGNLPADVSPPEMHKVFGAYGKVLDVNILPARSRSGQLCGFVHFEAAAQADACMAALGNGYTMRPGAEPIKVEKSSSGRKGGGKGDGKGGGKGFGGKGYAPY
eukprot:TRINITY_DN86778_c0_g1_i1.p1 TRINITY_DN86778_c0_g1~~TRINITY_DN86778_c0_g1_i1.p1  ORF type:complete len:271 (-),score=73.07 TRINITY_DN86778_c0_g1_i1:252-1001(-)